MTHVYQVFFSWDKIYSSKEFKTIVIYTCKSIKHFHSFYFVSLQPWLWVKIQHKSTSVLLNSTPPPYSHHHAEIWLDMDTIQPTDFHDIFICLFWNQNFKAKNQQKTKTKQNKTKQQQHIHTHTHTHTNGCLSHFTEFFWTWYGYGPH